jgi:hypothetical protein
MFISRDKVSPTKEIVYISIESYSPMGLDNKDENGRLVEFIFRHILVFKILHSKTSKGFITKQFDKPTIIHCIQSYVFNPPAYLQII